MAPIVKNSLNASRYKEQGEVNILPSLTIPDQSMSVQDILDRFTRGLPIGGQRVPVYDELDDLPDIRTLDLAERQELSERYTQELADFRQNEAQKAAQFQEWKKQEAERLEAEKQAQKAQKKETPPQP